MNRVVWTAMGLMAVGCLTGRTRTEYDQLVHQTGVEAPPPSERALAADEAELAQKTRLGTVLRIALLRNPDVQESHERVRAALDRVPAAARPPDLEFKYEQWGV